MCPDLQWSLESKQRKRKGERERSWQLLHINIVYHLFGKKELKCWQTIKYANSDGIPTRREGGEGKEEGDSKSD